MNQDLRTWELMHGCFVFIKIIRHLSKCLWFWYSNFIIYENVIGILMCNSQEHDIIKKRLDSHDNVIETRQEGIGALKVKTKILLWLVRQFYFLSQSMPHIWPKRKNKSMRRGIASSRRKIKHIRLVLNFINLLLVIGFDFIDNYS